MWQNSKVQHIIKPYIGLAHDMIKKKTIKLKKCSNTQNTHRSRHTSFLTPHSFVHS